MVSIKDLKTRFAGLNFNEIVGTALAENRLVLIEKQKEQMLHGLDSKIRNIGVYKDARYAAKKFAMNPLAGYGNYDLRLTNEFQRNIDIKFFNASMVFFSRDQKTEKIIGITSPAIFGLSAPFIKQFSAEHLTITLNTTIKKRIDGL